MTPDTNVAAASAEPDAGRDAPRRVPDAGVSASPDAGSPDAPLACDATGEQVVDGRCYLLGAEAVDASAASAACRDWGGTLVRLDSPEEEDALLSGRAADSWIGLNDILTEGTMLWETGGAPGAYAHWASEQPDDFDGSEDCVELLADGRGWNDRPCTDLRVYICER